MSYHRDMEQSLLFVLITVPFADWLTQQKMSSRQSDGPADDHDVNGELSQREFEIEGARGAAREREDDVEHHEIDRDAIEAAGDKWVIEHQWQALSGEDVDGGDDQRDEEVEGEAEDRRARTRFEGTRTEKSAGHALEDALRFDLEGYGALQAGRGGVEDAGGEGSGENCGQGVRHLDCRTAFVLEMAFGFGERMDGCEFPNPLRMRRPGSVTLFARKEWC